MENGKPYKFYDSIISGVKFFRIGMLLLMLLVCVNVNGKKYSWKGLDHEYDVTIIRSMGRDSHLLKVFAIAKNPDAAITQALQDAVAAAIFTGYTSSMHDTQEKPMWIGFSDDTSPEDFYNSHKQYFDDFFKSGEFLNYAKNVNSNYPSGENNIATSKGRRVGLNVNLSRDSLREKLQSDGIIRALAK